MGLNKVTLINGSKGRNFLLNRKGISMGKVIWVLTCSRVVYLDATPNQLVSERYRNSGLKKRYIII